MRTLGDDALRSSGRKALVTTSCEVMPLLYMAADEARISFKLSDSTLVTLAALFTSTKN